MGSFIFINLLPAVVITFFMFNYMHSRMKIMIEDIKNRKYAPNMLRSLVEIVVFALVYALSLQFTTGFTLTNGATAACTILAIVISTMVFNKFLVTKLKYGAVILAVVAFTAYYCLVANSSGII